MSVLDDQETIAINVEDNPEGCDIATCPHCQTRFYLEYPEETTKEGCIYLLADTLFRLIFGIVVFAGGAILIFLFLVFVLPRLGF